MTPFVIVSCGAAKLTRPAPARLLYTGGFFKAAFTWATSVTTPDRIRILSALHGLVPPDRLLEPYNLRLGQPGAIQPAIVQAQAHQQGIDTEPDVVVVGGERYVKLARTVWPDAIAPFGKEAGVAGIGYAVQRLNLMRGRLP